MNNLDGKEISYLKKKMNEEHLEKSKNKYFYTRKVKSFCIKCDKVLDTYLKKQGKIYAVVCRDCTKNIARYMKTLLLPNYWTNQGGHK